MMMIGCGWIRNLDRRHPSLAIFEVFHIRTANSCQGVRRTSSEERTQMLRRCGTSGGNGGSTQTCTSGQGRSGTAE